MTKESTDFLVSVVIKILSGSVHISWAWLTGEMISYILLKQTEVEGGEDTAGWRRAQLSALISHTGKLTPSISPF